MTMIQMITEHMWEKIEPMIRCIS